jgi:hypothetical protein
MVAEQPLPMSHSGRVHRTSKQLPFTSGHLTSHAHDAPQKTVSQEFTAGQPTVQTPGPHVMPRHELRPVHWMVHDAAPRQLMPLRHEPSRLHRTSHSKPIGQTIWGPQFAPAAQSMMQVLPFAQLVH